MKITDLWNSWSKFWFALTSPLPIALFRIFVGALLLQVLLAQVGSDYMAWYGPNGIIPVASIKHNWWFDAPRFDIFFILPRTELGAQIFYIVYLAALICLTVGFGTKYATIMVAMCNISMHNQQPFSLNGGDAILRIYSLYLVFSDCGAAWSVDSLIRRFKNPEAYEKRFLVPILGARLVQVQLCISYCTTMCFKIVGPQWLNGTAVYYATRLQDLAKYNLPFHLFDNLLFLKLLTWSTLVIETSMFTLVWILELRYWVLASAIMLHLGIDYTINLPVFEWAFMAGYITFVSGEDLEKFIAKLRLFAGNCFGSLKTLEYSLASPRSYSLARLIEGLDFLGRLELKPLEEEEMKGSLITINGISDPSFLFEQLVSTLPVFWLLYPLAKIITARARAQISDKQGSTHNNLNRLQFELNQ